VVKSQSRQFQPVSWFVFFSNNMAKIREKHPWIRWKGYPHFGPKLGPANFNFVHSYVTNPASVEKHKFYPLIYRQSKERRYKFEVMPDGYEKRCHSYIDEQGKRVSTAKCREIFYASHLDSLVFGYYANVVLGKKYEVLLGTLPAVDKAVLAYRKIPGPNGKGKNNIDFAKEVFDLIEQTVSLDHQCAAIALDISAFFDNLDHTLLLNSWKHILGLQQNERLPKDHYVIYKFLTNFPYVNFKDAVATIGLKHNNDVRRTEPDSFAKNHREFRRLYAKRGKIRTHPFLTKDSQGLILGKRGIPQGTPISAFLSNIYLLEFDKWACEFVNKEGGHYRRYSDDIVILCSPEKVASIMMQFLAEIKCRCHLEIKPAKTQVTVIRESSGIISCQCLRTGKAKPFQYLGFDFNGVQALIKQGSISKFYRRMKTAVRARCKHVRNSARGYIPTFQPKSSLKGTLFKGPLYSRYSYQGNKGKNRNYFRYAAKATIVMKNKKINKQLARAWNVLNDTIWDRMNIK
jgi:hypothetical protein